MILFFFACLQPDSKPDDGAVRTFPSTTDSQATVDSDDSHDSADTAHTDTLACVGTVNPEIVTVVDVDFIPGFSAQVEYGADDQYGHTTALRDSGHFALVGYPQNTEVHWRVLSDGHPLCTGVTVTGPLPSDVPTPHLSIDLPEQQSSEPWFIAGIFGGLVAENYRLAFNRQGEVIWYQDCGHGAMTLDFQPALDGNGLIYNHQDAQFTAQFASIRRTDLDGTVIEEVDTPLAHHMFTQLPDETLAFQQLDIRPYTDEASGISGDWVGDAIAEVRFGEKSETVFSVWDWLTPSYTPDLGRPGIYDGIDWTHGNALHYDATNDHYLLSLGEVATILDVDRSTAVPTQIFSANEEVDFHMQHDPGWLPDGHLLMFTTRADGYSGAAEFTTEGGTLQQVWTAGFTKRSTFLGQARRLGNGNTFINYGSSGLLQEVTPDGTVVWELKSPADGVFAQVTPMQDFAR